MFGIKTKIINKLMSHFDNFTYLDSKPISSIENKILIWLVKKELKRESKFPDIQNPNARETNKFASKLIKKTAQYMPNNLGNWSIKKPRNISEKIENNLIDISKIYCHCDKSVIGHCSSGTTEGNIYASWIGKKYLLDKSSNKKDTKIALIKSSLAHYSIDKAADIIGVKLFEANVNKNTFDLDLKLLESDIHKLYKKKYHSFLIPMTLGYTITGTDDNYLGVCEMINRIKNKYNDCNFFLWIDAAFSGITKMFIEENFQPFDNKYIQLLSMDSHKILAIPYPAGILLYRRNILNYIKKEIPYINQLDTTLLGSRSGLNPIANWFALANLNKDKMKKIIKNCLYDKESFLQKLRDDRLNIKIINNKNSIQAGLISQDKKCEKILLSKYKLRPVNYKLKTNNTIQNYKIYKLYFLPNFR